MPPLSFSPTRRALNLAALGACASTFAMPARSQDTARIKFSLDWRVEAPAAPFLISEAKGYFRDEKVSVGIDVGGGSADAVTRVASGAYDMGFADLSALMEFLGNNPDAPQRPVAVMMAYANSASSVIALKSSGIRTPQDLVGRKLGAPVFDASRRAFPIFASAARISAASVQWTTMAPPLREQMLARGDVDAITGFTYFSPLNLQNYGVAEKDLVVMPYTQYGVRLYGHAVIANERFLRERPEAVRGFLRALTRGTHDMLRDPVAAVTTVRQREPLIKQDLGVTMLRRLIASCIDTPDARAETFGAVSPPRLALMASQVADVYNTKTRIDPARVFDAGFLPTARERDILGR